VERIHWQANTGRPPFELVPGTEEARPADLVLLAMGFTGPEPGLLEQSGDGVFVTGDARRGQSLIVWAIAEGRATAKSVREWLDGRETSDSIAAARHGEYTPAR
jgi:glutamate synthase (NADPH/NADH) small chain